MKVEQERAQKTLNSKGALSEVTVEPGNLYRSWGLRAQMKNSSSKRSGTDSSLTVADLV